MSKSTQDKLRIGDAEFEILSVIAEQGPLSVREASDRLGSERRLARTTVGRMMDRLLAKGLLVRSEVDGVFAYRSTYSLDELRRRLLGQFVASALGGSLQPFVAYLHGSAKLSAEEMARLEALVRRAEENLK